MHTSASIQSQQFSFVLNGEGFLIQISHDLCKWLGYTLAQLMGKPFHFFASSNNGTHQNPLSQGFAGSETEETKRFDLIHQTGISLAVRIHSISVKNPDGSTYVFCNVKNIEKRECDPAFREFNVEEELELLINNTDDSFILLDKDLNIVRFNDQLYRQYKNVLGKELTRGKNIIDFSADGDVEKMMEVYNQVLNGVEVEREIEIFRGDGASMFYRLKYKPLRDEQGNISNVFVSGADITAKKESERLLSNSEKRYKALVENGMDAVVILTREGEPLYISPTVEKLLGYDPNDAAVLNLFSLTHPDDKEEVQKVWEKVLHNPGIPFAGPTTRIMHRDGNWRWMQDTITNMLHEPAINGIVDNFRDVTEVVVAQQSLLKKQYELEQAEANYREIFEKANEGILIYNIKTSLLVEANAKACELLGTTQKAILKASRKQFLSGVQGYDVRQAMQMFDKAVRGETQIFEWPVKRECGVQSWMEISLTKANIAGSDKILAFFRCIDERKKADQERAFQRMDKEALINSTKDLIWSVNQDRKLVAANEEFIRITQLTLDHAIQPGHDLLSLEQYPPEVISFWASLYDRAFRGERFIEEVFTPAYQNSPLIWTEVSFNPVFQNGKVVFIACYARDISERKYQQQQIKLVNEKLEISQQIAKLGVWELDLNTHELYSSDETYRIYGLQKTDGTSSFQTLTELIHPQDKELFDIEYQYALAGEKLFNLEHRIVTSTGLVKTVIQRGSVRYDAANNPEKFSGTIQDITDRKYTEDQLLVSQRQLNLIYNTVNEIIFLVDVEDDEQFRFQSVNQAFLSVTGLEREQVINKLLGEVIDPATYPFVLANYQKALRTGQSVTWEETAHYPTGEKTGVVSVRPIINEEGKCSQLIGSVHDITDLKKSGESQAILNGKLQAQAKALADSNLELERFAYVASHDLQEPLRMVSSFLKLLEKKYKGQLDETADQYIHYAVDGSERMKKMIMDLLAYSRVSTNEDVLTSTDMNAVVAEVLHIQQNKIVELGATINIGSLPILKNTRRTQMFQLLQNLIVNALKYHSQDPPVITINAREEIDQWEFSVKDNGVGFEQEFAETVFVMFKRLNRRSEFAGTGIGLSVCKKIVEIHHGNIWVESVPNEGSTFYFTIGK